MAQHKVIFTPSGIRATADGEQTVYDVAQAAGVDMQSICGGKGLCNRCQVEVEPGSYPKYGVTVGDHAILLVGHLMAPLLHWVFVQWRPEPLTLFTIFAVGCVGLSLYLLPRFKGAMIGFQWAREMGGFARS